MTRDTGGVRVIIDSGFGKPGSNPRPGILDFILCLYPLGKTCMHSLYPNLWIDSRVDLLFSFDMATNIEGKTGVVLIEDMVVHLPPILL